MDDTTIRLKAEIDEMAQMGQFGVKVKEVADALVELTKATLEYNSKGNVTKAVLEGFTDALHKVYAVINAKGKVKILKEISDGELERRVAAAEREIRKLNKTILDEEKKKQQTKIKLENEEYFAIQKIHELKAAASLKASKQAAKDAQDEYQARKKWHDALQQLQQKDVRNYEAQLGRSGIIKGLGALPAGADASAIIKAGNALQPAMSAIQKGQMNIAQLLNMIYAIKNNVPQSFVPINAAQQRAYNGLLRYSVLLQKIGNEAPTATKGLLLSLESMGRIFQVQLLHRAFSAVLNSISEATREAQKFQYEISRIRTISQDAQLTTKQWGDAIKRLASENNVELLDATAAAYDLVSNQIGKGAGALDALNESLKFSKVTGATAKDSVDLISFALNAFKLKSDKAHETAAVLFKTIDLGNVTAQEMAQSFGSVAPLAHQAGLSLRDFAANITTLTIQGIKFDTASTLMKNVLKELIAPSKEMQELIKSWGFNSGEAAIKTLGFHGVLKKLQEELGAGGLQRLKEIFPDIRGTLGAIGTFGGENLAIFEQAQEKFKDAVFDYEEANKIIKESPGQELAKTFNDAKIAAIGLGEAVLGLANNLTKTVDLGGFISFWTGQWKTFIEGINKDAREYLEIPYTYITGHRLNDPTSQDAVHEGAKAFREKQEKRLKDEQQDAALAPFNARAVQLNEALKDITGDLTPDQSIKQLERVIKKYDELAIKQRMMHERKNFETGLIGEDELKKLDAYTEKIGELANTKELQDIFNIDFTKLKEFSNFKVFDEDNLVKAEETFKEILSDAEKINTEINKNVSKATERIASLQKKQDESRLNKSLMGKSPGQQAKIYEAEINKLMLRIAHETDFDKRSKLRDEAIAFSTKRDALAIKSGKLKIPVAKDNLTDRLLEAAKKDAQNFIKENKNRQIDLNNLIAIQEQLYKRIAEYAKFREDREKRILDLQRLNTAEQQKQMNLAAAQAGQAGVGARGGFDYGGQHAVGGLLHGPMGRDNLLIRAHAGEFVVNSESTARFYPQLVAMNAGFAPRGFANGGPVTNVGDININMSPSKSVEANVREIGYRLRREIKRGTVRLN